MGSAEKTGAAIAKFTKKEFELVINPKYLRVRVEIEDFIKPDLAKKNDGGTGLIT